MSKSYRDGLPISPENFVDQLMRLKRGSIGRRDFLGLTGLGIATAVMAREIGIMPTPAFAAESLGDRMSIATWPNYHDPQTFENFKAETERGDAGQAAGRRLGLEPVRADQLHDLDLQEARHHRAARYGQAGELRRHQGRF